MAAYNCAMFRGAQPVVALFVGALCTGLGVPGATDAGALDFGISEARANDAPITVGTSLLAVSDVTLKRAAIRKGSRVVVTSVVDSHGRTLVDLELADGHVLRRIMMSSIRASFRVVG